MYTESTSNNREPISTDSTSFTHGMKSQDIWKEALSDSPLQAMIIDGLKNHFEMSSTVDRWMTDALNLSKLVIEQSDSVPIFDENGKAVDLQLIDPGRISMKTVSKCIPLPEGTLSEILSFFDRWSQRSELDAPVSLEMFKRWIELQLMRMWAQNDSVTYIADSCFGGAHSGMIPNSVYLNLRKMGYIEEHPKSMCDKMQMLRLEIDKISSNFIKKRKRLNRK